MPDRLYSLRIALVACCTFFAGFAHAAVDPSLMTLVPPDAQLLSGFRVQTALQSPFGQFLLNNPNFNSGQMQQFIASTGFDFRRDLTEVLFASRGPGGPGQNGLVLARGTFDSARMLSLARVSGTGITNYKGVDIVIQRMNQQANPETWAAFLNGSLAVMGPADDVRALIDRRGSSGSAGAAAALTSKATNASNNGEIWFATIAPPSTIIPLPSGPAARSPMPVQLLQSVQESSGAVRFTTSGADVMLEALTASEQDAQTLAGVLRIAAGMMRDPRAQPLQAAQFTTAGSTVRVELNVPEQQLEQLFAPRRTIQKVAR